MKTFNLENINNNKYRAYNQSFLSHLFRFIILISIRGIKRKKISFCLIFH